MKTICKCPKSKQTSSKRVIALSLTACAISLSFVVAGISIFSTKINETALNVLSKIIITFALAATGTQATTMGSSKSIDRQEYPSGSGNE